LRLRWDYSIIRAEEEGDFVKNEQGLRGVKQLAMIQIALALVMARLADVVYGLNGVLSVLLGGVIYALPHACFGWMMFKRFKTAHINQYLKRVYRGEATKVVLTIVLFALVFCLFKCIVPWVLLASFLIVQGTIWITPWIFVTRECD